MDDTNKAILRMLKNNGRMPFSEIGKKLEISRVAVKKRVQKLEQEGVIRGYRVITHREGAVKMFLTLTVTEDAVEEVMYYLNRTGYVKEIYILTGGKKLMAVAEAPEISELRYLVKMLNKNFKGRIKTGRGEVVQEVVRNDFGGVAYDETRYGGNQADHKGNEQVPGGGHD